MSDPTRRQLNEAIITEFRANAGKVTGQFADTNLLLLTTIGARTGTPHTWPLAYSPYEGNLIVFAANGGRPHRPGWYYNLLANPTTTIEVGPETCSATATITTGETRQTIWTAHLPQLPFLTDFQAKVPWEIPVISLTRLDA